MAYKRDHYLFQKKKRNKEKGKGKEAVHGIIETKKEVSFLRSVPKRGLFG